MPGRSAVAGVAIGVALVAAPPALAQTMPGPAPGGEGGPAAFVEAAGNPFTGGLGFYPPNVAVGIGQTVRWTNTDYFVPHTATEDNGLWDLAGSYGLPPISPTGFGPGASVERPFEAGTHTYHCRVHGRDVQSGTVAVPVGLAVSRRVVRRRITVRRRGVTRRRIVRRTLYSVNVTWSSAAPAPGQAFDVEVARGDGAWRRLHTATTAREARISGRRRGTTTRARARLRETGDEARATGWSPEASIVSR